MNLDGGTMGTILAVLVPAAAAIAHAAVLNEKVRRHDDSIDNFGKRIGNLEIKAELAERELSKGYKLPGEYAGK
jgi:hypothetical protein